MELAVAIDQFAYEYMNQVGDSEEHVLSIMNDLKRGNTEKVASYFKSIVEDHKTFVKRAEDILAQIEGFASGQKTASESGNADLGSGEDSHSGSAVIGGNNVGNENVGSFNTGDYNVGDNNVGSRNTGGWNTGFDNDGNSNAGNRNAGNRNSGNDNTGDYNTGDENKGYKNAGDSNNGSWNTGFDNEGDCNVGYSNIGNGNTGDKNKGDFNTGSRNTGDHNTGDWNKGHRNAGAFCTLENQTMMFFNRESSMTYAEWSNSGARSIMSSCPLYVSDRQNWWNALSEDKQSAIKKLPNFDAGIFREITGIDVNR